MAIYTDHTITRYIIAVNNGGVWVLTVNTYIDNIVNSNLNRGVYNVIGKEYVVK